MDYVIQNNQLQPVQPKKFPISRIILIVVGISVISIITLIIILSIRNTIIVNDVTRVLKSVPTAMDEASKNGGYPESVPSSVKTTNVQLQGGGSFDGMTYCVTATSTTNKKVVYYINSQQKTPQKGSCQTSSSLPTPSTPQLPSVSFIGATQVGLTWRRSSFAQKYTVQCASDSSFSRDLSQQSSKSLTATCSGLKPATAYYVRVRAENSTTSSWSNPLMVTTDVVSIPPPNLTVKALSSTAIHVTFDPTPSASRYILEYATDSNFTKNVVDVSLTSPKVTINNLTPRTVYYFHVKAVTNQFDASRAAFSPQVNTVTY